jgi:hypothetical protein
MAIELSNLMFTDQDDIVPSFGVVETLINTGIANSLAGNDTLYGSTDDFISEPGFFNSGTLDTGEGNDIIIGRSMETVGFGFVNRGTFNTGEGNDTITGSGFIQAFANYGTFNTGEGDDLITSFYSRAWGSFYNAEGSIFDTGDGNDSITIINSSNEGVINTGNGNDSIYSDYRLNNYNTIETGDGNDIIISTGNTSNEGVITTGNGNDSINFYYSLNNYNTIETGDGNDIISGNTSNEGVITTGNGNDSINSYYNNNYNTIETGDGNDSLLYEHCLNRGNLFLGEGNDTIGASTDFDSGFIENFGFVGTGEGNDIFTSTSGIYNEGFIETGNGDDSIIGDGGYDYITGTTYGIYNKGGAINMGDGNDSIVANDGFQSAPNSSGAWFLGEGEDYIKGYGSGDFYGGNGNDTLELTPGTYTVGIWGERGESPIFTKGDQLMITSEFEQLKAGSTIYDFTSLTAGQIIVVA